MRKFLKRRSWIVISLVAIGVIGTGAAVGWVSRHDVQRSIERASLPTAQPYQTPQELPVASTRPQQASTTPLPAEVNLAVPFTAQAPHANWEDPYGEFCEEASILMAMSYIRHESIPNADVADQKLLELWDFEHGKLGYPEDVTVAETARIIREYYKYDKLKVVDNPTATDIRKALADGKLVIVPAAGRLLGNPYYQQPGPLYHMLVVKGYTKDGKFITNDPGTRRGADFLYSESALMGALHDWRADRNIELGRKAILVVG